MALTGHLSDLSLSELIEFFCNQRKSGRLKVLYPQGAGYFYLQAGSVVDARIGVLHGIDAVYYALTLPNAEFEFSADAEAVNRTINQPWTQVVLEGLRRLDENIQPCVAVPTDYVSEPDELEGAPVETTSKSEIEQSASPAFFSFVGRESGSRRKPLFIGAVAVAVVASVAVIGVPAGWYSNKKAVATSAETVGQAPAPENNQSANEGQQPQASGVETQTPGEDAAALAARRQREKDRRAREAKNADNGTTAFAVPKT